MTEKEVSHKKFLRLFYENKSLTIETISNKLNYSVRSSHRLLKKIGYHCSFSHNNKWYTLESTPSFSDNGLWFYEGIGFSKHGNLSKTILYFVNKSHHGLTAKGISEIVLNPCHAVLNGMYNKGTINRFKSKGGYIIVCKQY